MKLIRLPNEIILEIASELSLRDVNSLLRTSRRFASLLNRYLYHRDVRHHAAYSLFWACENSKAIPRRHSYYRTVEHAIAAGADVNMSWHYNHADWLRWAPDSLAQWIHYHEYDVIFGPIWPIALATLLDDRRMISLLVGAGADMNLSPGPGLAAVIVSVLFQKRKSLEVFFEERHQPQRSMESIFGCRSSG